MAKVNLLPENIRRGQDICCGCKYYVDKDDYSWDYICNFRAKNDGAEMKKISEYECTGFEPDEYANSHWEISGLNYIGISENRLHHILGVARKAYKIAKDMGKDENFCRKCFMLGWIHKRCRAGSPLFLSGGRNASFSDTFSFLNIIVLRQNV